MNALGVLRCARYAYAPNDLRYCGPDTNGGLQERVKVRQVDVGLREELRQFEAMYPYLEAIAKSLGVADVFSERVVEAYWLGNEALEKVPITQVKQVIDETLYLGGRLKANDKKWLETKYDQEPRLHHSFHVLNVFFQTGHETVEKTVGTMRECLISWGVVSKKDQMQLEVGSEALMYEHGRLLLKPSVKLVRVVDAALWQQLQLGDLVSYHWGVVCEKITPTQMKQLYRLTKHHIELANLTL